MGLGDPWTDSTPNSVAKLNFMEIASGTGAELASLTKTAHTLVRCTSTGSGFILDHVYLFTADGTSAIDLTSIQNHTHNYADGDGGALIDIYKGNPEVIDLILTRPTDIDKLYYNQTVTGTGSIENGGGGTSKPYIRLRPNATSGSGATISYNSDINVGFMNPSILSFVGQFETATSLAFHGGCNADDVTAADSNTIKYQAEVCTTTNANWWLRTANGSANSASDTGVAITANDTSVKILHDPTLGTPEASIEISAGSTFTKTTNIPISGSCNTGNTVKFSIKNSTAADRPYKWKGGRISYITDDTWGYS